MTANTRDGNSERANTRDGHAVTGINTRDEDAMVRLDPCVLVQVQLETDLQAA